MPQPDYENDLVFPPKSADDLNEQRRQSDVLIGAIEKCEKLEQEVKRLRELLKECKSFLEYAHPVEDISVFEGIEDILTKIEECL